MNQQPMYCYNCGAHTSPGQNFCRTCGTDLRSLSASFSDYPPTWPTPRHRLQMIVDAVTDALRTGFQHISQRPTANLADEGQASRFRRWGLLAFWAGLAALLGNHLGVILILTGIGLMAYARGFFGPVRTSPSAHTTESQAPPSRETIYSPNPTRPSAMAEDRGVKIEERR